VVELLVVVVVEVVAAALGVLPVGFGDAAGFDSEGRFMAVRVVVGVVWVVCAGTGLGTIGLGLVARDGVSCGVVVNFAVVVVFGTVFGFVFGFVDVTGGVAVTTCVLVVLGGAVVWVAIVPVTVVRCVEGVLLFD
jgi:hypothetical protein